VLPAATRIKPWLTPLAALGLVIVMALAAITHVAIGEPGAIVAPLVLGSLAAFVAWGRGRRATLAPR
jgi:putative oxidoreductase